VSAAAQGATRRTPVPVALQLYSLREALAADPSGTIERVARMGFEGVEPFGLTREGAKAQKALFDEFGLKVPSVHAPLHLPERADEALAVAEVLGCERIASGYGPDWYVSLDAVDRAAAGFNRASDLARAQGRRYAIHNHWWEFEPVEGSLPYRRMLQTLDPGVSFQADVYWVQAAGLDPVSVLRELGPRVETLHMKDGSTVKEDPMTALGRGVVDVRGIATATSHTVDWWIVELDRCATDMFTAVSESLAYLASLDG
jgi:sugar phosphate isomerase/epimerase